MSEPRQVRSYEYVNRPYASVRDALRADAQGIFQRATSTAAARATHLSATLRVELGGVEFATEVKIVVQSIEEAQEGRSPVLRISLGWQAERHAALFPVMSAELSAYPLSSGETQLDLLGRYQPPMGPLGTAIDALVGHRVAEATVHRFLQDVADYLKPPA